MNFATLIAPETAPLDAALTCMGRDRPQAVRSARKALSAALASTERSCWPEIAWRASSLTNTGFPVELSWSSRDTSVRWTAEATGPETPEAERLNAAISVMRDLGSDINTVPDWLTPQPGQRLRFGAWVGGRHDANEDRYKLYVDLSGTELPTWLLPPTIQHALPSRIVWRMAGVYAETGVVELYSRLAKPKIWEIEWLLIHSGLDSTAIIDLASRLTNRPYDDYLLSGTAGFSLTILDGRLHAAGCFVNSSSLLGNDSAVAGKIRELAHHYGWNTQIYEAILGNGEPEKPGRHGMIGVGITADGNPWMQVGLRP